jgi:glucose/arabinose dehydrogenase
VSKDDPNKSDQSSEKVILQVDEPQSNHNAGKIAFGPNGYLHIPLGN